MCIASFKEQSGSLDLCSEPSRQCSVIINIVTLRCIKQQRLRTRKNSYGYCHACHRGRQKCRRESGRAAGDGWTEWQTGATDAHRRSAPSISGRQRVAEWLQSLDRSYCPRRIVSLCEYSERHFAQWLVWLVAYHHHHHHTFITEYL